MALSKADLDLIESVADPTKREAMRTRMVALDKEATDNGLRQAEFSKKMNEVTATHKSNLDWFNKAKGQWDDLNTENQDAKARLAALESAAAVSPHFDGPDDQSELQKLIKAQRDEVAATKKQLEEVTKTVNDFQTMIKDGKLLTVDDINKRGDALGAAVLDIVDFQSQARAEYGMIIPRSQLLEDTQKNGGDISRAYELLTKDARDKKLRETIAGEERKKVEDEYKARSVPYASEGPPILGPLQARLQGKKDDVPEDVVADGSGRLGSILGAQLRAEGKV
jgi:hypothetical protein